MIYDAVFMRKQKYVEHLLFARQLRIVLIVKFTLIKTEENRLCYFLT